MKARRSKQQNEITRVLEDKGQYELSQWLDEVCTMHDFYKQQIVDLEKLAVDSLGKESKYTKK